MLTVGLNEGLAGGLRLLVEMGDLLELLRTLILCVYGVLLDYLLYLLIVRV